MDPLVAAALERLKRATDKRDPNGYTAVRSADVIAVSAALKEGQPTAVTRALQTGAVKAGAAEEIEIFQRTDHLLHLIQQAG